MRRRLSICLSVLLLTLALAACGSKEDLKPVQEQEGSKENTVETNEQGTEQNAPETRKYTHVYGEIDIPVKPEKVVTLQYASQMLSVGLKPIGASSHLLENTGSEFDGIEDIGGGETPNYEKILELQPELIIAGDVEEDVYDQLSKIAPTVVIPWMDYDVFGHVEAIGDILNRHQEAAAWKTSFDEKIKVAREQIIGKIGEDKTIAIYRVDPKQLYIYGVRNMGFTLYKALELPPPPVLQQEIDKDANLWAVPISLELLSNYGADYVFVTLLDGEDASKSFEEMKAGSIWNNLPAVKENHVFEISMDTWLGYTPHDIETQLDEAVQLLTQQ
ncbi:ABC transporter substrate-binding protein [Paenibacillaceae bacterium]|nr:ABC transporter substrate-binding protein [Paenibacillaceae bacterium]